MSVASKRGSHNERFYEEYEYDKKLKKRRAMLITAAEEAFTHIKRIQENQLSKEFLYEAFPDMGTYLPSLYGSDFIITKC